VRHPKSNYFFPIFFEKGPNPNLVDLYMMNSAQWGKIVKCVRSSRPPRFPMVGINGRKTTVVANHARKASNKL
jgi:hypothetical protein